MASQFTGPLIGPVHIFQCPSENSFNSKWVNGSIDAGCYEVSPDKNVGKMGHLPAPSSTEDKAQ